MVRTDDGNARVVVFNGSRQEVDRQNKNFAIVYFDRYTLDLPRTPESGKRYREIEERSVEELFHPEQDAETNPKDLGRFRTEGHRRILSPLYALGFALIGLATILSGNFTRRSQPHRVTLAVLFLVGAQAVDLGLRSLCAKNPDLIPLMYVNTMIPLVIGSYYLIRGPRFAPRRDAPDPAPAEG